MMKGSALFKSNFGKFLRWYPHQNFIKEGSAAIDRTEENNVTL